MARYVVSQLGRFLLLMVAVAVVTFALVSLSPVDPLQANVGQAALMSMSEEKRAALAAYWGADTPMLERFLAWAGDLLHGDLGMSLRYNAPVAEVIASRAANSLALMGVAWVASGVLGFVLGVAAALREGRLLDRFVRGYCFVLAALADVLGGAAFAHSVLRVARGGSPSASRCPWEWRPADVTFADALHHMALPAITLSVVGVANVALHTRAKAIDVLNSDYVRFARPAASRGARRSSATACAIWRSRPSRSSSPRSPRSSAARCSWKRCSAIPGLGQAAVTAGLGGDVALLAGIALVSAALVFAGNLAANLIYGLVDPRMRPVRRQKEVADD